MIRIALGDASGARSDLREAAAVVQSGWASPQIQLATTLARLALLEGRDADAARLWIAVVDYRVANRRMAPPLSRWIEPPLQEIDLEPERTAIASRPALDALRAVVSEEFAQLMDHAVE